MQTFSWSEDHFHRAVLARVEHTVGFCPFGQGHVVADGAFRAELAGLDLNIVQYCHSLEVKKLWVSWHFILADFNFIVLSQ